MVKYKKNELRQISYEKYQQVYKAHLVFFNEKKISDIKINDIERFISKKENNEKLSESVLYAIQFELKSILDYSRNQYKINTVEIKNRTKKKEVSNIPILNESQKKKLLEYAFNNLNSIAISIILSMCMGLKTGEICALTKKDFDFKKNIISIKNNVERVKTSNNNKTNLIVFEINNSFTKRKIPIEKNVLNYICRYIKFYKIKTNNYLVSQNDTIPDPRKIQKELNQLCNSLSLACDFNTLRNTFIHTCLKNNMNIKFLCTVLGSQNLKRIYELCPEIKENLSNIEIEKGI